MGCEMKVLVTGATGFIGGELCVHLLKLGYDVLAQGRSIEKMRRLQKVVPPSEAGRLIVLPCELKELKALPRGINAVVHAAAVRDPEARISPAVAVETNVGGTVRLWDLAENSGAQRFVLLSSQSVYGTATPPWREDQQPEPQGVYALSKYAAEQVVLNRVTRMEPVVLRVSRVYGVGLFMRWDELIGRFVLQTREGKPIEIHGDGGQRMDLIHIQDLTRGISIILGQSEPLPSRVYNLGGGESHSVMEIAEVVRQEAIVAGFNAPALKKRRDVPPAGPRHLELDISRIRQELGWEPRVSLRDGVREYFRLVSGLDFPVTDLGRGAFEGQCHKLPREAEQ